MAAFTKLIRFESDNGRTYFADLEDKENTKILSTAVEESKKPIPEDLSVIPAKINSYTSFDDLISKKNVETVAVNKLLAPLPRTDIPIYCVGLNYRKHAEEAGLAPTPYPPLWVKPAAALADPGEDIPINPFCAKSYLDYEAELVFVTSRQCKDLNEEEAADAILGYTIGNDLSCREFQKKEVAGFQFMFAKGFDKFAPIGPALINAANFDLKTGGMTLTINDENEPRQRAHSFKNEFIYQPAKILSVMSQGTTIPAYTAVMTGTPSGVGLFAKDQTKGLLKDKDVVTITVPGIGVLKNQMVFV
ncbi:fumarylacetoacetate hydrolase family protein [Xylariaceae sp. FL0255]|nr:fumarylacetoacetate hydrolase family protein [Xylariaceae sp. FL0255]